MMSSAFDLPHWTEVFPLQKFQEAVAHLHPNLQPSVPEVISPFHVALLEQLRWQKGSPDLPVVDADVAVLSVGEPDQPWMTKLGGIPFRDQALPWPQTTAGFPMTFVGQFNFTGSTLDWKTLPGPILLIFAASTDPQDTEMFWDQEEVTQQFYFEWAQLQDKDLLLPHQLPRTAWSFEPVHAGQWHRVQDHVQKLPSVSEEDPESALLLAYDPNWNVVGLKLGGNPIWDYFHPECDGLFLGCIPSVFPAYSPQYGQEIPFPFLNHPEPLAQHDLHFEKDFLVWGEGAVVLFFLDRGEVRAFVQGAS